MHSLFNLCTVIYTVPISLDFYHIIIMPLETHLETPNTKYKRNRVENEGLFITCQQQGQWRLWGRYISIDVTIWFVQCYRECMDLSLPVVFHMNCRWSTRDGTSWTCPQSVEEKQGNTLIKYTRLPMVYCEQQAAVEVKNLSEEL